MTSILIVEDEPRIASFLEKGPARERVLDRDCTRRDVRPADDQLRLILDLELQDIDGLAELRRSGHGMPVIILTPRAESSGIRLSLQRRRSDVTSLPIDLRGARSSGSIVS